MYAFKISVCHIFFLNVSEMLIKLGAKNSKNFKKCSHKKYNKDALNIYIYVSLFVRDKKRKYTQTLLVEYKE